MGAIILRCLEAESAHRATIWALARGMGPVDRGTRDPTLATRLWALDFTHPIGLAAGFDKNGKAIDGVLAMGFAFAEIGGITPRPQSGNPYPRLFRLPEDRAVINRMGLNNDGMAALAGRLAKAHRRMGLVGINLASNTDSLDPIEDFEILVATFSPIADFLTVDISCPNTSNGRLFMRPNQLAELLGRVIRCRDAACAQTIKTPVLVKLSPDSNDNEIKALVRVCGAASVDGLIATNTSTKRSLELAGVHRMETGGLSGGPLFQRSTEVLRLAYQASDGRMPLIGVGGVASGADAYAKIRAGASLVQLYTALVYEKPGLPRRIYSDLARLLQDDGYSNVSEAVGADHLCSSPEMTGKDV